MKTGLTQRHLLGIRGLSAGEITHVLDTAESFREIAGREIKKVPTLRGRTVINLFFEASTRTRTSFEIAGKRLSADVINISSSSSSVTKGETLLDTARNLEAMGPDLIVIRHPSAGAPHQLARVCRAAVVNAGDGAHVVMVLRIQRERQDSAFLPSLREYAVHYGLNLKRLSLAKPDAIVMHPGPMNRGIEIASDVADGSRSLILDQVANGLAVRMAVLYLLGGGAGVTTSTPNPVTQTKPEPEPLQPEP